MGFSLDVKQAVVTSQYGLGYERNDLGFRDDGTIVIILYDFRDDGTTVRISYQAVLPPKHM